jgi:hypothetical protein
MSEISLKSLLVPSKTVDVEYPGMSGFVVTLSFLTRESLINIRKKSTKTSFKNRQPTEEFNEQLFLELYTKAAIKGWKGLKLSYVEQLAPVDLTGQNPEATLGFTEENALYLMKESSDFDAFITEKVSDLGNFSTNK